MNGIMKNIQFLGNSLDCIREFPDDARREAGYQLSRVQQKEIEIARNRFKMI